jgi:hypothetical protein
MAGRHFTMYREIKTRQFLSEKFEIRKNVTEVTLMSSSGFAAKNLAVFNREML